jgi:hypothetical protein
MPKLTAKEKLLLNSLYGRYQNVERVVRAMMGTTFTQQDARILVREINARTGIDIGETPLIETTDALRARKPFTREELFPTLQMSWLATCTQCAAKVQATTATLQLHTDWHNRIADL